MSTNSKTQNQLVTTSAPLVAGFVGGSVSTALLLPLDNIKVRLQVDEGSRKRKSPPKSKPTTIRWRSIRLVRGMIRHEGFGSLYQGLSPALIGSAVSWGGYFFLYEGFKRQLKSYKTSTPKDGTSVPPSSADLIPLENFALACSAGAIMVFLTNPFWLIKLRMQLQMKQASQQLKIKKPYNGMFDAARTIVREEGYLGLYKGTGPALLLTSHGGVQFVVYEFLRKQFHDEIISKYKHDKDSSSQKPILQRLQKSFGYLMIGATSKIVASTATYPLQVVKSRMQQRSEFVELTAEGELRVVKRHYNEIRTTFRRIWKKEGFSGFFKGCIPNAIRVAPSAAITFVVYEAVMDAVLAR